MRPVDLAREHGLSTQAIRNYDAAGVLPPTDRSPSGHRRYTPRHAQALRAFLALRPGHGHQAAIEIMRAIHRGADDAAFRLVDAAHIDLQGERDSRAQVAMALAALTSTVATGLEGPPLTVGEVARRLRVHPATLRSWEAEGILRPVRNRTTGHREYGADDVRDAEIARQLRRGGYPLARVARFLAAMRAAGGANALAGFLDAWQDRLTARSRSLLAGAAQLDAYLAMLDPRPCDTGPDALHAGSQAGTRRLTPVGPR